MKRRTLLQAAGGAALLPALAGAQDKYPSKVITWICPYGAGGNADARSRQVATAMGKLLGQTIIVDNKAGASGMIGLKTMATAKPDGYTIGQIPISVTRFSQLGTVKLDPLKDLTYLARVSGQTFGIAVQSSSPWKTLKDLVADAKAKPGQLTYASAGIGGATHVGMEEFLLAAGAQMNHIPFKGGSEALQGLLGGHVDALADSSSWAPHVQSGKLRLLATWGEKRTNDFKSVPTLKESGYDVVIDAPNGIGAPKGLDPAVEKRLREAFKAAAASPGFAAACDRIDAPLMYLDGPDYEKYVAQQVEKEKVLIERLKLKDLLGKG